MQSAANLTLDKGPFPHHMLKEIYEQPAAVRETLRRHLSADRRQVVLDSSSIADRDLARFPRLVIAASGASRHAGLAGRDMIECLAGLSVEVEHASEYVHRAVFTRSGTLLLLISQSGETADVIAALHEAQNREMPTLAVCNVPESTIAHESAAAFLTHAGREVAVPATKSFTTQLAALYLLGMFLGQRRSAITEEEFGKRILQLERTADSLELLIHGVNARCKELARRYFMAHTFFFLGRAIHYPIALEGALKLKEVSYIHAEGYPMGELVHGPFALLEPAFPVVAIATRDRSDPGSMSRYELTLGNLRKIRERSECLIVIASEDDDEVSEFSEDVIFVPETPELLSPMLEIIPLQLLAYYIATWNHYDPDRPRNLVKSVQTE